MMLPNHIHIHGLFNNENNNSYPAELFTSNKFRKENINEVSEQSRNNSFLRPMSPLLLKRSSLIRYDDSYLFSDDYNVLNEKDIVVYASDKSSISPPILNTNPTSSFKKPSPTEQRPSLELVSTDRSKAITDSKCYQLRSPLSVTISNENIGNIFFNESIIPTSPQVDEPLSFLSDKAMLSSCLSKCDSVSRYAATDIMKLMDFTDFSLVESLQNFIRKIPVIGESQERDRILSYFTDRFMTCNPSAFKNNDCCHTLVCAIMLLNTDIHGQVSKKRMTCKEFVDNILLNYPDNDYLENDLINIYNFIRKTELKNEESSDTSNSSFRHKFSKLITKSTKLSSQDNKSVNIDPSLLNQRHFISGNIMRKCIKRSFGKKPALGHRGWKLQFASLVGLQLLLFKTNLNKNDGSSDQNDYNCDRISLTDSNISSEILHNDDSSLYMSSNNPAKSIISKLASSSSRENVQVSVDDVECCIKIHHGFASVVEKLRHKNVFSLRLADQAEYFFKVKTDQLHSWINSVNYAAAMLSAQPIVGAGQCGLYKPLLPGYLTDLDKNKQIQSHHDQIRHYKESLKKLQLVDSKTRALNEQQIRFCKYEIGRFEAYVRLLRPQSFEDSRSDQITRHPDINSAFPKFDNQLSPVSNPNVPRCPQSAFNCYRNRYLDECTQDPSTLRRRPPKVPNFSSSNQISSAISSTSNHKIFEQSQIQMSPTADSLHSYVVPQYYIPVQRKPVTYSPQIGSHFSVQHSPLQSFSRFVEPSCSTPCYRQIPQIMSPLTTNRLYNHCLCQPSSFSYSSCPVAPSPVNQLPKYSPPSSSRNLHNV